MVKHTLLSLLSALALQCAAVPSAEPLFPNADFETGNLNGWSQSGDAFRFQPTRGDNSKARGREASKHEGQYWIGGFEKYDGRSGRAGDTFGDDATGELTSPEFTIEKRYITFLIGGGNHPGKTGVKLLCDGHEIDVVTGANSETLSPCSFDVSELMGKRARLIIYDHARGTWGHINVDSFSAADKPLPNSMGEFAYLEGIPTTPGASGWYNEPQRPQFHFTARQGWLNDPNGLVYDGTKYHLFFQHNPLAAVWGNMTWGHATSLDLIHWKQQDHALRPYQVDRRAGTIFSGTAIVDHNNSLGVQVGNQKTLCAFFTFATEPKFGQAMAYSTDGGATWKYWNDGRPVVENQGFDPGERDPKVFWHEPSQHWVMVLWIHQNPGRVRFFTSNDLVHWQHASDLLRDWAFECMDLFFVPVDGDRQKTKAVIYDASFDYEVGTFDGREFHAEHGPYRAGGGNYYAAQTFNNAPHGRVVQIGWMRGGPNAATVYGVPFNQQMGFPYELSLHTAGKDLKLRAWPIKEIETLVADSFVRRDFALHDGENILAGQPPFDLADLEIDFEPGTAKEIEFNVAGAAIAYDTQSHRLVQQAVNDQGQRVDTTVFEDLPPRDGTVKLRFLIDRLSVESFAFGGERFFAAYRSPQQGKIDQFIRAAGGNAEISRLEVRRLKSAWRD